MSGALVLSCWRFVFERLGALHGQSHTDLLEIWTLLATALFLGQSVCRLLR
jgi:hypothetical protein